MKLLVDTSILLHDFYFRHPEFASHRQQEQSEQLFAFREVVHRSLQHTAELENALVAVPLFALHRLASILSEYFVPNILVRQEFLYLLHNYELLSVGIATTEKMTDLLGNFPDDSEGVDADLLLLEIAAIDNDCTALLTSNTRGLTQTPGGIKLYTPSGWINYLSTEYVF